MSDSAVNDSAVKHSAVTAVPAVLSRRIPKKQAGMSFIAVFCLVGLLAFVGLFAFKVVPGYVEFMTVSKIADDTQADAELMRAPKSKVIASISQAYRHNNLWDLKVEDTIKLTKNGAKGYQVEVDYEKRANLLSNIYVVQSFKKVAGEK